MPKGHFDALMSYAKDPTIPQAEELTGRFADAVNYLKLGYALYAEFAAKTVSLVITDNGKKLVIESEPPTEIPKPGVEVADKLAEKYPELKYRIDGKDHNYGCPLNPYSKLHSGTCSCNP